MSFLMKLNSGLCQSTTFKIAIGGIFLTVRRFIYYHFQVLVLLDINRFLHVSKSEHVQESGLENRKEKGNEKLAIFELPVKENRKVSYTRELNISTEKRSKL
jgi:hypothetical protein